jgi:hypothetical protein
MPRRLSRRMFAVVLVAVLVGVICVEVYAHSYVKIDNLPVVNANDALTVPMAINGTCTVSSGGATWLIIMELPTFVHMPPTGAITFYIYKSQESKSLLTQSVDFVAQNIAVKPDVCGVQTDQDFSSYLYYNNCTTAGISYHIVNSGTYNIDIALTYKTYQTTLIGILPVNSGTIHFNATLALSD